MYYFCSSVFSFLALNLDMSVKYFLAARSATIDKTPKSIWNVSRCSTTICLDIASIKTSIRFSGVCWHKSFTNSRPTTSVKADARKSEKAEDYILNMSTFTIWEIRLYSIKMITIVINIATIISKSWIILNIKLLNLSLNVIKSIQLPPVFLIFLIFLIIFYTLIGHKSRNIKIEGFGI